MTPITMNAFRSARRTWRSAKTPLMLTFSCAFVGCAYFGLALLAGILPFALWFNGSSLFWPLWSAVAVAFGSLAILWVISIHVSPPDCC